jgi:hypothetical protein
LILSPSFLALSPRSAVKAVKDFFAPRRSRPVLPTASQARASLNDFSSF